MEEFNYRCGWCGQYTDYDGTPIGIPDDIDVKLKEKLTYGECCRNIIEEELELERHYELYLNGEL